MSDETPETAGASSQKYSRNTVHRRPDGAVSACLRTPRREGAPRHPDDPTHELEGVDLNSLPRAPVDRRYF